jgi:hypothetical protein
VGGGGFCLKDLCKVLPLRYFQTFFCVFALESKRKAMLLLFLQDLKIDVCTFLNSGLRIIAFFVSFYNNNVYLLLHPKIVNEYDVNY